MFIGKTFVEHLPEFIENCPYGKQIGNFLDQQNRQKRPQAQKPISWVWILKNLKTGFYLLIFFEKYMKFAHEISVQNGSYTSPNELMRHQNNEKPIWVKIQKHCKNAVTI